MVDQLKRFGQVSEIAMLQHLFTSYGAIDNIVVEENAVKMMKPDELVEPLSPLIEQLLTGREFACAGGQTIYDTMMVSKGINLLETTSTFNEDIR